MPAALDWLFSLETFGIKFGLDNITALVEALGRPDRSFHALHIAGTNGKGSVTAMVDAAVRAAGHRSARYTSPHLVDLAERFVIDGKPVSQATLAAAVDDVRRATDELLGKGRLGALPTFFEVTTAVAFELFRRARVEVAVCEVGLGGRLDATNVLEPIVTAITSIGFDHQQYLGDTLAAIASEKAGIVKPGVPVVVGHMADEALQVIEKTAAAQGAPVIRADRSVATPDEIRTPAFRYRARLALPGRHQRRNALVSVLILEELDRRGVAVPPAAIIAGLEHVSWPGRLQTVRLGDGREALLDAAHNVDGAAALAAYLRDSGCADAPIVFAVMRDKDAEGMLRELAPVAGCFIFTGASNPRSADPDALSAIARRIAAEVPSRVEPSLAGALASAWTIGPRIVVAGSIFLLGDAMKELGCAVIRFDEPHH